MTTRRPFRREIRPDKALAVLMQGRGKAPLFADEKTYGDELDAVRAIDLKNDAIALMEAMVEGAGMSDPVFIRHLQAIGETMREKTYG